MGQYAASMIDQVRIWPDTTPFDFDFDIRADVLYKTKLGSLARS